DIASAQSNSACVYYRDIRSLNLTDEGAGLLTTTRNEKYLVTFRNFCRVRQQGESFVLYQPWLGTCIDHGDALSSGGSAAPCIVESVSLAPDELALDQ
ncbi:MAG: hypothetical protein ACKVG0_04535, partial [Alphaproteobacteria bacterium]